MKVKLARDIGFCSGVKRAFELVLRSSVEHRDKDIYTLGPLIHNPQAVELLKERGIRELKNISGISSGDIVVIRTHGVTPSIFDDLMGSGCDIVNATCPKVERVQRLVKKYVNEGYKIILVGDKGHPEIEALLGFSNDKAIVVERVDELEKIDLDDRTCVLFQTTFNRENYEKAVEIIRKRSPGTMIFDTLCDTTSIRQKELISLSGEVDAIVVVGGKDSANTRRLYEIARGTGKPSFFVESADEINPEDFTGFKVVGVTAGASTPSWIISEVVEKLEHIGGKTTSITRLKLLKDFAYFLVQSRIFAAIGSIGLTLLVHFTMRIPINLQALIFPLFFILAVHTLEDIKDWSEFPIGEYAKARFFNMYKRELKMLGVGSIIITIFTLALFGIKNGAVALLIFLLLLLYANRTFPPSIRKVPIQEIMTALVWLYPTTIFPITIHHIRAHSLLYILPFVFSLILARAIYSSTIDIRCDRVLNLESLAHKLGLKQSQTAIDIILFFGSFALFWGIFKNELPIKYYLFLLLPLYLALAPTFIKIKRKSSGYAHFLLDGFLYLAIIISLNIRN